MLILQNHVKELYTKILKNKLIAVCVLFTIFTLLDTIGILVGLWPAKLGAGPYVHLLGRFIIHSILVGGLFLFDVLQKKINSKLLIYAITFLLTWGFLLVYVWSNSLFTELHPDAYKDVSTSYLFLYILLGGVILVKDILGGKSKKH